MIDLLLAWLTGAGVLVLVLLGILVLGYISRFLVPIEDCNNPFKYPSWTLTPDDIIASLVAGAIAAIALIVPIVIGSAILT